MGFRCADWVFMAGLSIQPLLTQQQILLPNMDEFGRFQTLNGMGKIDPSSNEIIDEFVAWSVERAQPAPSGATFAKQMHVLEIAGGFGFVGRRLLERGVHFLFNDASEMHAQIADQILFEGGINASDPSQYEILPGFFPQDIDLFRLQAFYPIVGVGMFQAMHFMRAEEIRTVMDTVWTLLQPGGRFFITASTPWNKMFRGYPPIYRLRKAQFFRSPQVAPYPGEIEDAHVYLPEDQYPKFFHALDADVLTHLAESNPEKPYRVLKAVHLQRPNPPTQSYRWGYSRGYTELVGIVLEKPYRD